MPKIAISQAPYQRDMAYCLNRTLEHMRMARQMGADLVVFPEWFLGLNPLEVVPNRQTDALCRQAQDLAIGVVTGSLRTLDPDTGLRQQCALVIDADGRILGQQAKCEFYPAERPWFDPGEGIAAIATRYGRAAVLLGLDAENPERWEECRGLFPDLVFMVTSARGQREAERLQELAVARSFEIGGTVVLVPLTGRFGGINYVPCAMAAHRGRVLASLKEGEQVGLATATSAALIQLGAVDAASWAKAVPIREPSEPEAGQDFRTPEPERRVLLDWKALVASDPLQAGRQLLAQAYDAPRQASLAPAHPQYPEVLEALLAEGARGAFAWPGLAGTHAYDPRYRSIAAALSRQGKPLIAAAGLGAAPFRFSDPGDWDDIALAFPELTIILAIHGRHPRFWEDALALAEARPNVALLTAGAAPLFLQEALQRVGAERLLFASGGWPGQFQAEWEKLETVRQRLGLEDETFQRIAALNARRLFFHDLDAQRSSRPTEEAERPR
ncbi:MAG: amidohydrolase family protein [Clostridia bacterium]